MNQLRYVKTSARRGRPRLRRRAPSPASGRSCRRRARCRSSERSRARSSTAVSARSRRTSTSTPSDPTKGSIVGTVQLDFVNTRDHDRDAALLDKDWFNVKEFPEAKFESQKIEKGGRRFLSSVGPALVEGPDEAGGA